MKNGDIHGSERDELLQLVLDNVDDLIAVVDLEGRRIYNSPSYRKTFGDRGDLHGTDSFDEIHPEDREWIRAIFRETVRTGQGQRAEFRFLLNDGTTRYIESQGNLIRNAAGAPDKVVIISRDVTERRRSEETLRRRELHFKSFFEHSSDIIVITDEQYGILRGSPSIQRTLGYTQEEIEGRSFVAFLHSEDVPRVVHTLEFARDHPGTIHSVEHRLLHKLGAWRVFESVSKLIDDDGRHTFIITSRDITERNRAEEFLRETNYTLQTLIRTSPLAIVAVNFQGIVKMWNKAAERMFGWLEHEVLGVFIPITPTEPTIRIRNLLFNGGDQREVELVAQRKDGQTIDLNMWTSPLRDASGNAVGSIAIFADITQRKLAEKDRARLSSAVEQAAEAIVITDAEPLIVYVNPAFERITGYSRAEATGQSPRILKSGKQTREFYEQMWTTLLRGEAWSGRLVNKRKDGTLYEEESVISPVRDETGAIVNYVAVKRDITREREMERQLRQSQKMESLGQLAGGIAHDVNNVLGVIGASLAALQTRIPDPELRRYLEMGDSAVSRGAEVAKRLLTFSRDEGVQLAPVSLGTIIGELSRVLESTIEKTIDIQTSVFSNTPLVEADQGQLYQVLLNLCVNARDAILDPTAGKTSGTITISAQPVAGAIVRQRFAEASGPLYVQLSVQDTGSGMTEEVRQWIFDPFFTTKPRGKGTGLGLAVVYGIVRGHRGFIGVESQVGKGSLFSVYLQAHTGELEGASQEEEEPVPGGTETVLIVEDESALRDLLAEMLQSQGYCVLTATDGVDALEVYRTRCADVDVIICDMGLPRLSGEVFLRHVLEIDPGARIIVASGYTEPDQKSRLFASGVKAYVQKPYQARNILKTLRDVLHQPR